MSASPSAAPTIPSELRLSRQTDVAIEQFLLKAGTGLVTCGLASFVLFGKIQDTFT